MAQQINDNFFLLAGIPLDDRNTKTTIGLRDAIPATLRYEGLMCYVSQVSTLYQLQGGIENANWIGISGSNVTSDFETEIEGFLALSAGKNTLNAWEVGDKFRGWIGTRYVVGSIVSLPVSLPSDIDDPAKVSLEVDSNETSGFELLSNKATDFTTVNNTLYPTVQAVRNYTDWIKSNESLAGAKRKGDVLYEILDQYTGEEIILSKVTGTPTVDGVIYFQLGAEYFKRNVANAYNSEWWGLSTTNTSANNTTALQSAIDLVITMDNLSLIERKSIDILLPSGDIQLGNINFKGVVHLKGAGKTATRIYYNGNDYLFKGDTANIMFGGVSDLTMVANNALNKGFIYMFNCINMNFYNIVCNGAVFGFQILEHSIKLESKEDWFVGANNNVFNTRISNFNIKGGVGSGIYFTGDFGSAQTIVKDGVLEAMDGNAIVFTSTSLAVNSSVFLENILLQGYANSGLLLENVDGFSFNGYFEQGSLKPAVIIGGGKPVKNVRFFNCAIGTSLGFDGVIFKSGSGLSFANSNIIFENISISTPTNTDILTDLAASNIKIKNIRVNNAVNINIFRPYDKELGSYEVDLGRLVEDGFIPKETLMDCPIPNGMISYFRGASLVNTSIRRQKTIAGGGLNVSQHDINTDVYITDRTSISLGNKNNYYPQKYVCYRLINKDVSDVITVTAVSATINGLASFDILPNEGYDVAYDGVSDFIFTLISPNLDLKADIDSPDLSGTPTAPTATAGTNTTQIATTAFVQGVARPYKVYTAITSQSGTSAPTATVLENTFGGAIVWTYSSTGTYTGTLTGAFTNNKTIGFLTNSDASQTSPLFYVVKRIDDNTIQILNTVEDTLSNDILTNASLEIRVYN